MKTIRIEHDDDMECPMDAEGQWTLYTGKRNSIHFLHPDKWEGKKWGRKEKTGLAFRLEYHEHSLGAYSLQGEGMQCRWDTVPFAGWLVWNNDPEQLGAKTKEDRARDARAFLASYNAWANGEGLWYSVEEDGEVIDSCGGFLERDYMSQCIAEHIQEGEEVEVVGEAACCLDRSKLPKVVMV